MATFHMSKESAREPRSDSSRKIEISSEGSEIYGAMVAFPRLNSLRWEPIQNAPSTSSFVYMIMGSTSPPPKNTKTNRYGILPLNE